MHEYHWAKHIYKHFANSGYARGYIMFKKILTEFVIIWKYLYQKYISMKMSHNKLLENIKNINL